MRVGEHFCPGILHAVPARDGLLLRIRVPGGLIQADQLKAAASVSRDYADGFVEITSRANLQLRAIGDGGLSRVVDGLSAAGLLPSPQHDRVRNIVTSPIAGLDAEELIDPRPLVRELDEGLRSDAAFSELHPKFSFSIFGGPRRFSCDQDDLSLSAVRSGQSIRFQLSIGGTDSGLAVSRDHAVECMLSIARACLLLAKESGVPARAKQIGAVDGAMQRMIDSVSIWLLPCVMRQAARPVEEALVGICQGTEMGRVSIVPSVPLGRLTAEQAACLAETAGDLRGDLRLAAWRGIVLASVPKTAAEDIVGRLRATGLGCDASDGFRGIAACAGIAGCDASLADVRGDAARLAQRLSRRAAPRGWAVNLSGCEKQCGRRHAASAELIAGQTGYSLSLAGQRAAQDCSPAFAIEAIAAEYESLLPEAAVR